MPSLRSFALIISLMVSACAAVAVGAEKPLLAHYMPWYATKQVSGQWGWHWTMDHYDPDQVLWEGKRPVASHEYPLMGLYDSGDDQALECQVLLMKLAGLDGVIIDWYGTSDRYDYAVNHRNTQKLIPWLKKAGLRFAICYEDQAIKGLPTAEQEKQVTSDLQWAQEHWFKDSAYVQQEDRPVLLVFGPQGLAKEAWSRVRVSLTAKPLVFGLPHLAKDQDLDGRFGWPPVTGGKALSAEQWRQELAVQNRAEGRVIAAAFPGFKDIYQQAGVHASYGSIAAGNGTTLAETIDLAQKSPASLIQIATWNDYGEGTVIEPTQSQGYRYLEQLQKQQNRFTAADLRLPVQLYQLRKRGGESAALNQAAALLFEGKGKEADAVLASVSAKLGQQPAVFADSPEQADANYHLTTDLLYREGEDITPAMRQRCRLDVYVPAKKRPFSTVIWFHGGGLTAGERSIPMPLRNQGVAVVTVNYRRSPDVQSPAFIEDAAAAVAWTFKHISEYGGSPDRLFISGHSAGAYLSTLVGLDKHWLEAYDIDANRLAGIIPFSSQMITHFTLRAEQGIPEKQPTIDRFAPLYHVRADAPPMLILTGDREKELMGRYEENA